MCGGELRGDPSATITGAASLTEAADTGSHGPGATAAICHCSKSAGVRRFCSARFFRGNFAGADSGWGSDEGFRASRPQTRA